MDITFLGTGTSQGIPVIGCKCDVCVSTNPKDKRLRTSALITSNNLSIVIDTGPDFRQQMLRENIQNIDAILFTHEHKDHIGGLDDVRAFNFINKSPMEVYAEERVQEALKREYSYIFNNNKYPGVPKLNLNTIREEAFSIKGLQIIPIRAMHYNLPILGFRIGDLSYITDANYISEEEKQKIVGSKYLIINALRTEKHISHFSLQESLELIKECAPKQSYLIHMSHKMGLHDKVNNSLPANVSLAYDGLKVSIK